MRGLSQPQHPAPAPTRFLIADDHEVLRYGVRKLLEQRPGWIVCGEASNGREAIDLAETLRPDVAILDVAMPELDGIEATRRISKLVPSTRIMLLSAHASTDVVRGGLAGGAHAFLLKTDAASDLVSAVETLLTDHLYLSPRLPSAVAEAAERVEKALSAPGDGPLTPREREVVRLVAAGKTSKQAAKTLGISAKTANAHRANVMRKLGIHSVVELVHYAMRNHLFEA